MATSVVFEVSLFSFDTNILLFTFSATKKDLLDRWCSSMFTWLVHRECFPLETATCFSFCHFPVSKPCGDWLGWLIHDDSHEELQLSNIDYLAEPSFTKISHGIFLMLTLTQIVFDADGDVVLQISSKCKQRNWSIQASSSTYSTTWKLDFVLLRPADLKVWFPQSRFLLNYPQEKYRTLFCHSFETKDMPVMFGTFKSWPILWMSKRSRMPVRGVPGNKCDLQLRMLAGLNW